MANEEDFAGSELIVFFLALSFGLFCRTVLKYTKIPYTVLILLFGIIIAGLMIEFPSDGRLNYSVEKWVGINPHILLFSFLPVLIFESSFNADAHIFQRELSQVIVLAFPGVLISTFLTAIVVKFIFPYDWEWNTALMVGGMLSATDPVAVVAIMKELGVSKRLATLMEGESLLNDGTGIVVFTVFKDALTGEVDRNVGEVIGFFLRLSLGGPLIGFIIGYLSCTIVGYILNDAMSEISITIIAAFGAFILAEGTALEMSGVLAVVIVGLYFSNVGRSRVSSSVEHALHSFWELASYLANTVIFFISGLIMVDKAFSNHSIKVEDWGYLILLYIFLHLIRFLIVLIFWPYLKHKGYGLSFEQGAVLVFGGLRGAVGLTLALIVEEDKHIDSDIRDRVLFHMSGIAFLTLIINGTSIEYVLKYLGLNSISEESDNIFQHACNLLQKQTELSIDEMREADRFLRDADWSIVWQYLPVHTKDVFNVRLEKIDNESHLIPSRLRGRWKRYAERYCDINTALPPILEELFPTRERLESTILHREQESIDIAKNPNRGFSKGPLERRISQIKSRNTSLSKKKEKENETTKTTTIEPSFGKDKNNKDKPCPTGWSLNPFSGDNDIDENPTIAIVDKNEAVIELDDCVVSLRVLTEARRRFLSALRSEYWNLLEKGTLGSSSIRILLEAIDRQLDIEDCPLIQWPFLEGILADRLAAMSTKLLTDLMNFPFIGHILRAGINWRMAFVFDCASNFVKAHENVLYEMSHGSIIESRFFDQIKKECTANMSKADAWINQQMQQFPEIARAIKTKVAAGAILRQEREHIGDLLTTGQIQESEYKRLMLSNTVSMIKVQYHPPSVGVPSNEEMLKDFSFIRLLPNDVFRKFLAITSEKFYSQGNVIYEEGTSSDGFFLLVRGSIRIIHRKDGHDHHRSNIKKIKLHKGNENEQILNQFDLIDDEDEEDEKESDHNENEKKEDKRASLSKLNSLQEIQAEVGLLPDEDEKLSTVIGSGTMFGAIDCLTNTQRGATMIANSLVQLFYVDYGATKKLMMEYPDFEETLWKTIGRLICEKYVKETMEFPRHTIKKIVYNSRVIISSRSKKNKNLRRSIIPSLLKKSSHEELNKLRQINIDDYEPLSENVGHSYGVLLYGSFILDDYLYSGFQFLEFENKYLFAPDSVIIVFSRTARKIFEHGLAHSEMVSGIKNLDAEGFHLNQIVKRASNMHFNRIRLFQDIEKKAMSAAHDNTLPTIEEN